MVGVCCACVRVCVRARSFRAHAQCEKCSARACPPPSPSPSERMLKEWTLFLIRRDMRLDPDVLFAGRPGYYGGGYYGGGYCGGGYYGGGYYGGGYYGGGYYGGGYYGGGYYGGGYYGGGYYGGGYICLYTPKEKTFTRARTKRYARAQNVIHALLALQVRMSISTRASIDRLDPILTTITTTTRPRTHELIHTRTHTHASSHTPCATQRNSISFHSHCKGRESGRQSGALLGKGRRQ